MTDAAAQIVLLLLSALAFSGGGVFMKLSAGLSRPGPTALIFVCFAIGVVLQTLGMRRTGLASAYVFVLGFEAILVCAAGLLFFKEPATARKAIGVVLVLAGIALLRVTD
jgi:small multidrug resistance pump/quaternary ammonium compound-resistance protein SugE